MKKNIMSFITLIMVFCLSACGSTNSSTSGKSSNNLVSLFQNNNIDIILKGCDTSELFGEKFSFKINDETLYAYEYSDSTEANNDLERISDDGTSYEKENSDGTTTCTNFEWHDKAYFYSYDNFIILYVGSDKDLDNELSKFLSKK